MGRTGGRAARGALAVIAVAVLGVVLFLLLRTETADDTGPRDAEPAATAQGAPRGGRVTPPVAVAEPIRLEVSGPDGRPVAGAVAHRTERLADDRRTPWDSLAHGAAASGTAPLATTDAAGRAEIAVDGDAPVPLRVSAAGYEPALVSAMRGTNAVRLARGWRVRGVVLDERRAGVPGALVAAVELREGLDDVADGRARFVTTGADGRFETDAVASGQYVIFAGREPSLVGQAASVVVAADVELTLTLGAADLTLRGQVSDAEDGAPIPGARVEAQLIGPRGSFLRTAVARVDGSFVLEQLETAFVHRVRVRADGYAEVGRRWGGVAESPPRTGDGRNLSLAMQRAATIQGRVLLGGAPAPGVEVSVWERRSGAFEWSRRVATSGSDGRYEVPGVEPGTCVVDVHAAGLRRVSRPPPGYRSASRADRSWGLAVVDVRPGSKTEHDVEVVATQRCVITVVAPDKTPVVGAVVEPARGSDERAAPGRTDASGEIAVELLDDGQAGPEGAFRVTAPGFRRQAVTVSAAQRHTVTLEAGWTVTGRVERDRAGAPDAVVRAVSGSAARHPLAHRWEMGAFEPIEARAGPDGRFELRGVPMREFVIVALGADRVVGCSELIAPREGHALPEVVVKITPLRVRGRVHGATGPVAGAAIYSVERSAVSSTRWWAGVWIDWTPGGTRTPAQTFSGPDGAFEFAVPAGVEHVVWASDGTTLSGSVTLPAAGRGGTTDIELQVSADEGIHGVVSTEGGAPVAGVSVRLLKLATSAADAGAIHSAITGPDGTFRFPGVQGEWYLRVVVDGGELFGWTMKVTGPSDAPVRVQIPRRREARGVVLDGDGVPCRAADIVVTDARGGILTNATTGPDGTFVVSIPDGEDVIVRAGVGVPRTELTVAAASSGSNRLELRLPRARPMRVRVVDAAGAALVGVSITYLPPQPHGGFALGSVVTGPDGRAETVPLPAGAYDFKRSLHTADRPDPQRTTVRWDLSAGEVEVRFTD